MSYIINVRRSIALSELIKPSKSELMVFKEKIKRPEFISRIYKVNNHVYGYIYVNEYNGNIMSVAATMGSQICPVVTDDIIRMKNSRYDEALRDGDFGYCIMMSDGQYKLLSFDLIKDRIPAELIGDIFLKAYKTVDYGFNEISKNIDTKSILESRRLSPNEYSKLSKYINEDDEIAIYRAQGSKSTPLESAISWTVELDVAKNFANNYNLENDSIIYKAKVKSKDVTAYVVDRDEYEIIVDYRFIKDIECIIKS